MKTSQFFAGVTALVLVCGTLRADTDLRGQRVSVEADTILVRFGGGTLTAKAKTVVHFNDKGIPDIISAKTPDQKVEGKYDLDDKGNPENTGRLVYEGKFNFEVASFDDFVNYHLEYLEITTVFDKKSGRFDAWVLKAIASDNKAESTSKKKTTTFDLATDRVLKIDNGRIKIGDTVISMNNPYTLGGVVRDSFPGGKSPFEK